MLEIMAEFGSAYRHSSGTGGTGKSVYFTEYRGVHKSGGDLYRQAFGTVHVRLDNQS